MQVKPAVITMTFGALAQILCTACTTTSDSRPQDDCKMSYAGEGSYANGKMEYFTERVNALWNKPDGGTRVTIGQHSRVFLIPANADPSFVRHASDSLKNGTPVHVAVETTGNPPGKKSLGELTAKQERGEWIIRWLRPAEQHASCR